MLTGSIGASGNISHSQSTGSSSASSWSNTNGTGASINAAQAAQAANSSAASSWREAAEFNAEQARIQREWQERMANTVYQRSVADMRAAGINPILAAGMGLGTASVGSGAVASMTAPSTFMANTFADQNSASQAQSQNQSTSDGSGWSSSESGLATALVQMGTLIDGVLGKLSSGLSINVALDGLSNLLKSDEVSKNTKSAVAETWQAVKDITSNAPYSNDYFLSNGVKQLPSLNYYIYNDKHHSSGAGSKF